MKNMKKMSLIALVLALLVSAVCPGYADGQVQESPEITIVNVPVEISIPVPVEKIEVPADNGGDDTIIALPDELPVEQLPVEELPLEEQEAIPARRPAPKATRKPVVEEIKVPTEVAPTEEPKAFEVSIRIVNPQEMYFVGDIIRIESEITGECANPNYQWQVQRAAAPEAGWVDIEGATESYYEFAIDTTNYADTYRVIVTDAETETAE